MSKYLYVFNYQTNEKDLCEMEFRAIFKQPMTTKYYLTDEYYDYQRSVFIRGRLDIICMSDDFNDLVTYVTESKMCYYNFKVIYIKNDITHVHYKESLEKCKELAFPIDGSINMQHPDTIFALTKIKEQWIFGIYHNDMIWNKHINKPYSYSHSLSVRDARTLVNIAVGNSSHMSIVDPCCGVGTVVLEGLSMGLNMRGYDINREVSYQARLNLEHFDYNPLLIERVDIHDLKECYDVAIMDIPYGVYSPFTYEQQVSLLKATLNITNKLVLVTHELMNKELEELGYVIIDQCCIRKASFDRYITLCQR